MQQFLEICIQVMRVSMIVAEQGLEERDGRIMQPLAFRVERGAAADGVRRHAHALASRAVVGDVELEPVLVEHVHVLERDQFVRRSQLEHLRATLIRIYGRSLSGIILILVGKKRKSMLPYHLLRLDLRLPLQGLEIVLLIRGVLVDDKEVVHGQLSFAGRVVVSLNVGARLASADDDEAEVELPDDLHRRKVGLVDDARQSFHGLFIIGVAYSRYGAVQLRLRVSFADLLALPQRFGKTFTELLPGGGQAGEVNRDGDGLAV